MPKIPELYNGIPIPHDTEVVHLRHMVKTPGPQAWAACMALGYKNDAAAFEVLEELAASNDWRCRRISIEAMAFHHLAMSKGDLFCKCLEDPSPYVVRTACKTVAQLGLDCAHNDLRRLVHANDALTRSAALRALRKLWKQSDFDLVFEVLQGDSSKEARSEAAWTLRENADGDNWERLFELWRTDPLHRHRIWACELANKFGDKNHTATLRIMLEDSDGHVRAASSRALEKLLR